MNFLDSVSNVEIETPMALIYKALSPSLSTFETLPNHQTQWFRHEDA